MVEQIGKDIADAKTLIDDIFEPGSGLSLGRDVVQPLAAPYCGNCDGVDVAVDFLLEVKDKSGKISQMLVDGVANFIEDFSKATPIANPTPWLQTPTPSIIPLTVTPMAIPTQITPSTTPYFPTATRTLSPTLSPTWTILPSPLPTYTPTSIYVTPAYYP
jgi:hypothetical protein